MFHKPAQRQMERGHPPSAAQLIQYEAVRIVCAALGLACVVLALRIASIW